MGTILKKQNRMKTILSEFSPPKHVKIFYPITNPPVKLKVANLILIIVTLEQKKLKRKKLPVYEIESMVLNDRPIDRI